MKLAYSYLRMSTDRQLKGDSLRRQLEASEAYAKANNLHLVTNLQDIGLSAFKGKNATEGALSEFLNALDRGKIPTGSVLIIESIDRLSRENVIRAFNLFTRILESGIQIVTLADNQLYTRESISENPGQLFTSLGIMLRANDESLVKSKRLKAAWKNKRDNADARKLTAQTPSWLDLSKDRKSFIINESAAQTVKRIFDMSTSGMGTYSIARTLNSKNVPTLGKSRIWHKSYVTKILNNRSVFGEFQPKILTDDGRKPEGSPIPNYYPAIVSIDTFLLSQAKLKERKIKGGGRKGPSFSNLFTKLLVCHKCQGSVVFVNKGNPPKGGRYLRCHQSYMNANCDSRAWDYDHFEQSFLKYINEIDYAEIARNDSLESTTKKLQNEKITIAEQITDANLRVDTLLARLEDSGVSESVAQAIYKRIDEYQSTIDSLNKRSSEIDHEILIEQRKSSGNLVSNIDALNRILSKEEGGSFETRFLIHQIISDAISFIELKDPPSFIFSERIEETVPNQVKKDLESIGIKSNEEIENFILSDKGQKLLYEINKSFIVHFKNGAKKEVNPFRAKAWQLRTSRMGLYLKNLNSKSQN